MKSIICLCLFLVFTPLVISAQQSDENREMKVVDRKDGSAIPHAVVQLIPKPDSIADFWMTDEKGIISLPAVPPKGVDSIKFRCMGYLNETFAYTEMLKLKNGRVELSINPIMLEEARVYPSDALIELGNYVKKPKQVGGCGNDENDQFAVNIENKIGLSGTVQKVRVYMANYYGGGYPFRLRFFAKEKHGKVFHPGEDLLNGEILIVTARKRSGWKEIDVSKYGIKFPEDGLFAGIQILAESYYPSKKEKRIVKSPDGKEGVEYHLKIPLLGAISNADHNDVSKSLYLKMGTETWGIFRERTPLIQIVVKKE